MKEVSYILIPGLGDQKPLFGWFYSGVERRWTRKGMRTQVFRPLWISAEPYEEKYRRLTECIKSEQQKGRGVALVGVSAGDALGVMAMAKLIEPPIALISICGFVRQEEGRRGDSSHAKLSWHRAAEESESDLTYMTDERRSDILCLIPSVDRVVEPERQRIDGAVNVTMNVSGHLWGIVVALLWRRRTIQGFVNERI